MTKLAIFCEGLTEQLFAERLVEAIAGPKVAITKSKLKGKMGRRSLIAINAVTPAPGHEYYIQILDCGGDVSVASDVREQYETLVDPGRGNFQAIIAIRDVYPNDRATIPTILANLPRYIPTKPVAVTFILAIMEIEAWFLAEHTHFPHISPTLDVARIQAELGFNPETDDMETRAHPAADLHACYKIDGQAYEKSFASINRTIRALDIDRMYLELGDSYPSLGRLNEALTKFLR